jgi:pimeloyl-ACP methyl ester carboxylesterase
LPVDLAFHGAGSSARQMERYTRFNDLAAKEGFLVVYPEAVDGNWNNGRGIEGVRAQQENIDDVKFARLIVDRLSEVYKIDRSRIYCTGISNGAFMSRRLATEASDLIAAIALVVGVISPSLASRIAVAPPMPEPPPVTSAILAWTRPVLTVVFRPPPEATRRSYQGWLLVPRFFSRPSIAASHSSSRPWIKVQTTEILSVAETPVRHTTAT